MLKIFGKDFFPFWGQIFGALDLETELTFDPQLNKRPTRL